MGAGMTALDHPTRYAHAFLAGESDPRPAIEYQPLYSDDEWRDAAYCALDGDASDLLFMHVREEAFQAFQQWVRGDYERREFTDFDNWLDWNKALYGDAIIGRTTDREITRLSADHKKFVRTNRGVM